MERQLSSLGPAQASCFDKELPATLSALHDTEGMVGCHICLNADYGNFNQFRPEPDQLFAVLQDNLPVLYFR